MSSCAWQRKCSAHAAVSVRAAEPALFPDPSRRKLTSSWFISFAWVHVMAVRPVFTTNSRAPLVSLAVRSPEALIVFVGGIGDNSLYVLIETVPFGGTYGPDCVRGGSGDHRLVERLAAVAVSVLTSGCTLERSPSLLGVSFTINSAGLAVQSGRPRFEPRGPHALRSYGGRLVDHHGRHRRRLPSA
jgi:hypothetical protein